jgi:transposase
MATSRRVFDKEFKLQVLRELQAGSTIPELARHHQVHAETIRLWKRQHRRYADNAFAGRGKAYTDDAKVAQMERAMGQLALENALLKKAIQRLEALARDNGARR